MFVHGKNKIKAINLKKNIFEKLYGYVRKLH